MLVNHRRALAILPALLAAGACASAQPTLQGLEPEGLYAVGQDALREGHWDDAVLAFERFVVSHPGHPRYEEARYRLGEAYFGDEEYISAGAEFNRLAADFPASEWADDARFQVCRSYERLSPPVELDQQYTQTAVGHCASLIQYYPQSDYVAQAQEIIERLRGKLALKEFERGEWYRGRGLIDSAIINYGFVLQDYPDTYVAPRALLRLYQAYRELGYDEEAEGARTRLLAEYPDSPAARELGGASPRPVR